MGEIHLKPYKGYLALARGAILPFLSEPSPLLSFGSFIAILIECDWDRKHPTYGCLTKSDIELASRWKCNPSTVWRCKKRLLAMGLLIQYGDLFKIKHFELFEMAVVKTLAKTPLASTQELFANLQNINANPQEDIANLQDYQDQNRPQSFNVSSKGDLSLSQPKNSNEVLSDEDIDWIDQNLKEEKQPL